MDRAPFGLISLVSVAILTGAAACGDGCKVEAVPSLHTHTLSCHNVAIHCSIFRHKQRRGTRQSAEGRAWRPVFTPLGAAKGGCLCTARAAAGPASRPMAQRGAALDPYERFLTDRLLPDLARMQQREALADEEIAR